MYNEAKIRNIKFVRDDDADYLTYAEQLILRGMHVPRLVGIMSKSDQLSRTLERVVRSWVAPAGGTDKSLSRPHFCQY